MIETAPNSKDRINAVSANEAITLDNPFALNVKLTKNVCFVIRRNLQNV